MINTVIEPVHEHGIFFVQFNLWKCGLFIFEIIFYLLLKLTNFVIVYLVDINNLKKHLKYFANNFKKLQYYEWVKITIKTDVYGLDYELYFVPFTDEAKIVYFVHLYQNTLVFIIRNHTIILTYCFLLRPSFFFYYFFVSLKFPKPKNYQP